MAWNYSTQNRGGRFILKSQFEEIVRKVIPYKMRLFLWGITPKVKRYFVYKIVQNEPFSNLTEIDKKFIIRSLQKCDKESIIRAYSTRDFNYFERHILSRLSDPKWVGFAVENRENGDIAYISWVVRGNVDFIVDLNIDLKPNQFFLRDAFCVPEYRRQGLNTRMDEERINYCIYNGANEILFQIGGKSHPEQNILRRYNSYANNGIEPNENISILLIQKNNILIVPRLGIHSDIFSFFRKPFKQ